MHLIPWFHASLFVEIGLTALALYAVLRAQAHRAFPAMAAFLAIRLADVAGFGFLPYGPHSVSPVTRYAIYFYSYWTTYLIGTLLIFLIVQQVFRHLMTPFPGLSRLGIVAFRWVAVISVIVVVTSSLTPVPGKMHPFLIVAPQLMRCMSILELCLLAFLALTIHMFGLSYHSRIFGISLGFGLMASIGLITSALQSHHNMFTWMNLIQSTSELLALVIWSVYFLRPEPARRPVLMPASSSLLRWNEVAASLGHTGAHIAVPPAPAEGFFLSDVEKVVEKILIKNSLKATGS